jgi:hypothetical protein
VDGKRRAESRFSDKTWACPNHSDSNTVIDDPDPDSGLKANPQKSK